MPTEHTMQPTILGAMSDTGRLIGKHVPRGGHGVAAFVRDAARLAIAPNERITTVTPGFLEPDPDSSLGVIVSSSRGSSVAAGVSVVRLSSIAHSIGQRFRGGAWR
jgi:putative NADH-flavin reductase